MLDPLREHIRGASVLDLFAGAGVLSAEILSRGARNLVAVERSPRAAQVWKKNMELLSFSARAHILIMPVQRALKKLVKDSWEFSLLVADPPYAMPNSLAFWAEAPFFELLSPGGILIIEQARRAKDPAPSKLTPLWKRETGDTMICAFQSV